MDELDELRQSFRSICDRLGSEWHFRTAPAHDGSPHIEIDRGTYRYVVTERGGTLENRQTESLNEVLYWLTSDLIFSLAGHFELNHRVVGQDSRRIIFDRELYLFNRISPEWADRKRFELDAITGNAGFPKLSPIRLG